MITAFVVKRAIGGCVIEALHDDEGHRYTTEDTARNANELHALVERAALFVSPPNGYRPERGTR